MYTVGIDLGGTNIVCGVVDEQYTIVAKAKCRTDLPRPAEDIVADMEKTVREAVANAGLTMDDIASVGVGCPGTCNLETGVVEYSNNLKFENLPLRDMLKSRLNKEVYIENDANAAALGEALAGADIATVPYSVIEQMTKHPLTDAGIAKFRADYEQVFGK